jgi:hypothetical protein
MSNRLGALEPVCPASKSDLTLKSLHIRARSNAPRWWRREGYRGRREGGQAGAVAARRVLQRCTCRAAALQPCTTDTTAFTGVLICQRYFIEHAKIVDADSQTSSPSATILTGARLPPDGAAATRVLRAAAQSAARFRRNPREHSLTCLTLVGTAGAGEMHLRCAGMAGCWCPRRSPVLRSAGAPAPRRCSGGPAFSRAQGLFTTSRDPFPRAKMPDFSRSKANCRSPKARFHSVECRVRFVPVIEGRNSTKVNPT